MQKEISKKPPEPSISEVEKYLDDWKKTEIYSLSEESLSKLFKDHPSNNDLNEIIVKVCSLDVVFSAGVSRWFFEISKHILKYDFDAKLKDNILDVNDFAKIEVKDKKTDKNKIRNFYSFATKYCSHHNPKNYTIYDSYVDKTLWYFECNYHFGNFAREDLKKYPGFEDVLKKFVIRFGLKQFKLRDIDKYLWLVGKEYFSR